MVSNYLSDGSFREFLIETTQNKATVVVDVRVSFETDRLSKVYKTYLELWFGIGRVGIPKHF